MKPAVVSIEELGLETRKVAALARRRAVLVRAAGEATLVLRGLAEDEFADDLVCKHPAFRASIGKARRNRLAGKGIPLADAKRKLGL